MDGERVRCGAVIEEPAKTRREQRGRGAKDDERREHGVGLTNAMTTMPGEGTAAQGTRSTGKRRELQVGDGDGEEGGQSQRRSSR
ncbi:Geranylgeranyl diphosphate reductase [Gracilaria domingensis]|nr:Geranylgeranyl diphosphate reductase [Gracilaria domingensis]